MADRTEIFNSMYSSISNCYEGLGRTLIFHRHHPIQRPIAGVCCGQSFIPD